MTSLSTSPTLHGDELHKIKPSPWHKKEIALKITTQSPIFMVMPAWLRWCPHGYPGAVRPCVSPQEPFTEMYWHDRVFQDRLEAPARSLGLGLANTGKAKLKMPCSPEIPKHITLCTTPAWITKLRSWSPHVKPKQPMEIERPPPVFS